MGNSPGVYEKWRKQAGANPAAKEVRGTYTLFIGADHDTHVVDMRRLHIVLDEMRDGYTVVPSFGRRHGKTELSVMVTILDSRESVMTTVEELKIVLRQDSIGIVTSREMWFV